MKDSHTILLLSILAGLAGSANPGIAGPDAVWSAKGSNTPATLRAAIEHLAHTPGAAYPNGEAYLNELDQLDDPAGEAFRALQRKALVANPRVSAQRILFVERRQYPPDHHNTGNIFQTGEINTGKFKVLAGGALKTVDPVTGRVETLLLSEAGTPRDPEVRHDGKKIVLSLRRTLDDDYHLYELNPDGTGLTQLTFAAGVSDIDPFYLSDGDLAFSSTREPKYCACNRHIMANLFRMKPDGANIEQIGKSIEFEGHGIQLPNGMLLYNRWEYVDRNFGGAQGLWTSNPDGTGHALYYGQHTPHPVLNARPVPGSDLLVCILSSCHDRPWGALALLDRNLGVEGKKPITRIWPAGADRRIAGEEQGYGGSGGFDNFRNLEVKYEDPFALDQNTFLVTRTLYHAQQKEVPKRDKEKTGIFLVDTFGNELLLHAAEAGGMGCYDAMPLAGSPPAATPASRRNLARAMAYCVVANVYEGTHLAGVAPGSVKAIRVVENPPKQYWTASAYIGQGAQAPAMNNHDFDDKMVLGVVPVEPDGSAYFEVPADRFIYLQLLDEKGKMIQSMRSGMSLQPGEMISCTGCHEDRNQAPPSAGPGPLLATRRAPSRLDGWLGDPRHFGYTAEVQPVFDQHCLRCHDYGKEAGKVLNLAGDKDLMFNASYMELHNKKFITVVGGGPNRVLEAYTWGAHPSRLVQRLDTGRCGERLSTADYDRIVTWLDLNAPYYPTHASAYEKNPGGRSPLTRAQLSELARLTDRPELTTPRHGAPHLVSFDRPERSPVLAGLEESNPEAYAKALALIKQGRAALHKKPRADMPGFVACEKDRERKKKYDRLARHQRKVRAAIARGEKVYDQDLGE